MVTRVCVLRSGGDFTPDHVRLLASQVPGLVCLSDVAVEGVPTVPLHYDFPGWWSKAELFSGSISGDLFYIDLDTVVLGDIKPLIEAASGKTTMLSDFYWPEHAASGLMYIAERDKGKVWSTWLENPQKHMNAKPGRGTLGDQGFLAPILEPVQRWQDVAPGKVVSYKAHCRNGLTDGALVCCFHGKPRPWDVSHDWMPRQNYQG